VNAGREHRVELGELLVGQLGDIDRRPEARDVLQPGLPLGGERLDVRIEVGDRLAQRLLRQAAVDPVAEHDGHRQSVLLPGDLRGPADELVRLGGGAAG
jgi:hypothetical protein